MNETIIKSLLITKEDNIYVATNGSDWVDSQVYKINKQSKIIKIKGVTGIVCGVITDNKDGLIYRSG